MMASICGYGVIDEIDVIASHENEGESSPDKMFCYVMFMLY